MARYIDAELLKEVVLGWEPSLDDEQLEHEIDTIPTADVVEIKRGEWINVPPYRTLNGQHLKGQECSVCHSFFVSEGNTPYSNHPYCCECGAKMDGGAK